MSELDDRSSLPAGTREAAPPVLMVFAISLPLALVAAAALGGGIALLVLALLAVIAVAASMVVLVGRLTRDPQQLNATDRQPSDRSPKQPRPGGVSARLQGEQVSGDDRPARERHAW